MNLRRGTNMPYWVWLVASHGMSGNPCLLICEDNAIAEQVAYWLNRYTKLSFYVWADKMIKY
jgi:hypothetical protein